MKKKTASLNSVCGKYGETFAVLWDSLPEGVKKKCNGMDLAALLDVMRGHYVYGWSKGFDEGKESGKFEILDKK
jgi:hypothetical protein